MFKNYLKITWRNLVRQKAYSFINIAGLAIGIAACMLILMWAQYELSFDRFNDKAEDIYRVVENQHYADGEPFPVAVTPTALAPALKNQFPEIVHSTRYSFRSLTLKRDTNIFTEGVALVDPDIFKIFTFYFIEGNPQSALSDPHSLVLTEAAAKKYFGDLNPLGEIITVDNRHDFVVTGVIQDTPGNSHLKHNILAPFEYVRELGSAVETWAPNWVYTYVLLKENTPYEAVNEKIADLIQKNKSGDAYTEIYLQPLTKIHLYSSGKFAADIGGHGDIQYIQIFSGVTIFVLLIACINFMNLATARSERRSREIGLRKVAGAQRIQLVRQFLGESIFISFLAFLLALILTELFLPVFDQLTGRNIALGQMGEGTYLGFVGIALAAGLIAGSYPAVFLSSLRPVETLKSKAGTPAAAAFFRRVLVVVQFGLSVAIIVATIVVSQQMDYIRNKNLGLEKENLGYIWMAGEFRTRYETAKQELLKNPNISSITATSQLPTFISSSTTGWDWEGKPADLNVLMHYVSTNYDYVETFQMEMVQGRFFSPEFATDSVAAVVNETAVRLMGMTSPIGMRLSIGSNDLHIIGVVKDFHFQPIQNRIEPMVLLMIPNQYNAMVLRVKPENINKTIQFVENTYNSFNADTPFYFGFMDQDYDNLYRAEQRMGIISGYFSVIAILISCLGLYGLASYLAERRSKEIGIRKVLGASVNGVVILLAKEFVKLVMLASVLAWPFAWYAMNRWLQNFAYRTEISLWVFILSGTIALLIALTTVSSQAIRAALANPIESIRCE